MKLACRAVARSITLVAALGSGCSLAPPYERPALEVPEAWRTAPLPGADGRWQPAAPGDDLPREAWWSVFGDAVLNELEADAATANAGLAVAAANLARSRAARDAAVAARRPRVDAGFAAARGQPSQVAPGLPDNIRIPAYEIYRADLNARYEVDLFGRLGDAARAAAAEAEAEAALYHAVLLGVHADVAQNYFLLRQAEAELAVERRTLTTRAEAVALLERRVAAGDLSDFDLARTRAELESARARAIALERTRAGLFNALALLTGRAPAALDIAAGSLPATLPAIPAMLPSTLLERRPDIAAAERDVMAATARIGVARAAFYPVLNLTARYGAEAGQLGDLLDSSNRVWALGPLAGALLAAPLFDGGRNQAALDDALARLDAAAATYRERVLTAFREVEDALVGIETLARQETAVLAARTAAERAYAVAQARYDAGQTAYLDVLDARRTLAEVSRDAATVAGERALASVALVRALGGGWKAAPLTP